MNRYRLVLAGLAIVSLAAAGGQGIMLRRELKEHSTETYSIKTELKQSMTIGAMGDQEMGLRSSMKMTLKTGSIDPESGQAAIESVISEMKTEADGLAAMLAGQSRDAPKEIKSTGKLDVRNRLTMATAKQTGVMDALLGGSNPASSLFFVEFPEKGIAVGDTWTMELPKSALYGNKVQTLTAKLVGEKDHEDAKVWIVSVEGVIKIDADMSEMLKAMPNNPAGTQKATIKGDVDLKGEALVDQKSGKTRLYTSTAKTKNVVELEELGMTIDSVGSFTSTMSLQK